VTLNPFDLGAIVMTDIEQYRFDHLQAIDKSDGTAK